MVVTGVADRVTGQIKHLVYLDAFLPTNGKSLVDYVAPERQGAVIKVGREIGCVGPIIGIRGLTKPEAVAWSRAGW